jgi:hypothetical protein
MSYKGSRRLVLPGTSCILTNSMAKAITEYKAVIGKYQEKRQLRKFNLKWKDCSKVELTEIDSRPKRD